LTEDWVVLKQQVKEASDIVAVVGGYLALRPLGPTFKGLCPFHEDNRPSFDVDPRRQRYRCWACGKFGDVINFVQEFEKISFPEALELLARRAGISLESVKNSTHGPSRALMLDVVRWAAEQFKECLLDSPQAEAARLYLGERHLVGETVRRFGLGFAPGSGDWLVVRAANAGLSTEVMEQVGLIARSQQGSGYYDRFRDRVMFPIRDMRGVPVGFGGRILPNSAIASRAAKYYNSAETPLFSKSDQVYGIDEARQAAQKEGWLAVVEGYTDVLMAHQKGIKPVVATMGTALNERHVKKLRGLVSKVILVFDADTGGEKGVDRAMEVFVSQDMDLRIATLPEGLDPCDLLVQQGPEAFKKALESAVDVFEFKLRQVWAKEAGQGLEGQRRAVEGILSILAAAPAERSVKMELMINRIAHRLGLKEETLWTRLRELRAAKNRGDKAAFVSKEPEPSQPQTAPAAKHEVELLEVILADADLLEQALAEIPLSEIEHPGVRRLMEGLANLALEGITPDLDHLRGRIDNEKLLAKAQVMQDRGSNLDPTQRREVLTEVIERFRHKRTQRQSKEIKNQAMATDDHDQAIEILKRLRQNQNRDS